MPEVPEPRHPHPHGAGRFSRWQYHQDQLRQQWAHHQYLAFCIEQLQPEMPTPQVPAESSADEIMWQVLARYNWKPLPRGRPRLVKHNEGHSDAQPREEPCAKTTVSRYAHLTTPVNARLGRRNVTRANIDGALAQISYGAVRRTLVPNGNCCA
jgi:hypothetical protein